MLLPLLGRMKTVGLLVLPLIIPFDKDDASVILEKRNEHLLLVGGLDPCIY